MNTDFNTAVQPHNFVPKVFSEQVIWRIKAVNRAMRNLKEMGYQPIDYDLKPDMCGVCLQIRFISPSFMRPLKDRSQRYEYDISTNSKEKRCYVHFDDIVVWWKELP